jgi:Fic family protein
VLWLASIYIESLTNLLLDGFEGKLTTERWAKLAKSSHDTALRDIQDLIYDAENRLSQVDAGATAVYIYDADGVRV